jgi:hypothetical protein
MGLVTLAAEQKRLELDLDSLPPDFAGTETQPAEVDPAHDLRVARSAHVSFISTAAPLLTFDHGA